MYFYQFFLACSRIEDFGPRELGILVMARALLNLLGLGLRLCHGWYLVKNHLGILPELLTSYQVGCTSRPWSKVTMRMVTCSPPCHTGPLNYSTAGHASIPWIFASAEHRLG